MRRPHLPGRDWARPGALAIALAGLLALGGCDLSEDADLDRGRALFQTKCGTCHELAQAATTAETGPDLDAAFEVARAQGADEDTIEGVVQAQIANPRPASPDQTSLYMPADLVTGEDAEDVAAYVASVAGVPGAQPPAAPGGPGGQVFANNGCGSCHVLEAAGSAGQVGPNLDESLPGQGARQIETSIVDPGAQIVAGFDNVMPANYEETIPADQLRQLVEFLVECAGEGEGCEAG